MAEFREPDCLEKRLSKMNEAQRQAVVHGEGPLLLLAGPGSGKTFTITNRILYLLEQGVAPEAILVITFTKEAALSMQNRFQELAASGGSIYYPVNFGTFHSVFYHILQESHVLQSNQLLRLSEKKTLLFPILQSYSGQQETNPDSKADSFSSLNEDAVQVLSAISFYKNTMELSGAISKVPVRWQSCFEAVCRKYDAAVKRTGRIDFDDMLYDSRKLLLENKVIRGYWQKCFRHILMDEFQDINPVQYEVVKLLSASPYNLFAVGDDDQAIYGFRGSEPDCLKRFQEEFHARQLLLGINYRSSTQIVQASLAVISENKNRFQKQLLAAEQTAMSATEQTAMSATEQTAIPAAEQTVMQTVKRSAAVTLRAFTDKEEEYAYMLQLLSAQVLTKESCAVLFRTNSYMQGFAARCKAADIPYEMREKVVSIYEHFIVADIMSYLLVAQGEGKREHMLRIMNKPSRYISREAVGEGPVDIRAIQSYYHHASLPEKQRNSVLNALARMEKQLLNIRKLSPLPAVNYILKAAGYEQYLKDTAGARPERLQEWQELLEWLKEDAARFASVREWKHFQEEYTKTLEQGGVQMKQGGTQLSEKSINRYHSQKEEVKESFSHEKQLQQKTAVHLLTVHGSKGLEFDRVWIPDCNEKNFPHGRMPDEKSVEEERRIFYVAMTRAKKSLGLLYLTGTKERPRQPSRFLNPLREQLRQE